MSLSKSSFKQRTLIYQAFPSFAMEASLALTSHYSYTVNQQAFAIE